MSVVPVITVDGPGGTGKGTLSRMLAKQLGWHFLDSGVLYRVLALAALEQEADLQNESLLTELAWQLPVKFFENAAGDVQVLLRDQDVTQQVRTEECGEIASQISVFPAVRQALVDRQRAFRQSPGLVADGRDMGTIIFPDAPLKIFLIASQEERAQRRYNQLKNNGINVSLAQILTELQARDWRDQNRPVAPLVPAKEAVIIDTTLMTVHDVLVRTLQEVKKIWPSL